MPRKKAEPKFVSLGFQVIDFIETLLVHGPGDVEGDPIEIDDDFAGAICRMYELDAKTGRRKVARYTLSRPKGRAKSELAAMLIIVEALGPCRFSHLAAKDEAPSWWGYAYEPGEPVGKPVRAPFIRCLATEEGQTGATYKVVRTMLTSGRLAELVPKIDAGATRSFVYGPDGRMPQGEIRPATSEAASKDGGLETFTVADEIHLYKPGPLKDMYETVDRNCRKRKVAQPWMLNTTTAFLVGQGSVAEDLFTERTTPSNVIDHIQGVADLATLHLNDLRGPRQPEWKALRAALEASYGPAAAWMDLDTIIQEEFVPKRKDKSESARYFLNVPQKQASDQGWLKEWPNAWAVCSSTLEPVPMADTWVGVDGSYNRDSTSVAWVQMVEHEGRKRFVIRQQKWTPRDGGKIPYDEVRAKLRELCAQYAVKSIAYDPRYFTESASDLEDEGYPMIEVPQSIERMTPICGRAAEAVLAGEFAHNDDPDLRLHVHNAAKKVNDRGFIFSKVKSGAQIDAWIAAILALGEACVTEKKQPFFVY